MISTGSDSIQVLETMQIDHWCRRSTFRNEADTAHRRNQRGLTLMELVIAVVIVGILAAIAWPSYQAQMRKGHRAAAQSYMMDLAQAQGQYLVDARVYASTEAQLRYSTPSDVAPYYTIGIAAPVVSPPAFTITATAVGAQVADGDLTLDNQGTKTPSDKW